MPLWTNALLIVAGAAMIAIALVRAARFAPGIAETGLRRLWRLLSLLMMALFLFGYAGALLLTLLGRHQAISSVASVIFALGVLFVLLTVSLAIASFRQLEAQVEERTARLRRQARDLEAAKQVAESANRAKSQFLANMSHELRTPLNSVVGFANILRKNKGENLKKKELLYLDRIVDNGKQLLALINDILDLSKIETGHMEVHLEEVDVERLILDTVGQFAAELRTTPVKLSTEMPPRMAAIESDRGKLAQVLVNLISNAIKFTSKGNVRVRVAVGGRSRKPFRIDVIDTGIGIPEDKLERIFEEFRQADGSTSREYGGTGLGLSISRSLCRLMGYDRTAGRSGSRRVGGGRQPVGQILAGGDRRGSPWSWWRAPGRCYDRPNPPPRQRRSAHRPKPRPRPRLDLHHRPGRGGQRSGCRAPSAEAQPGNTPPDRCRVGTEPGDSLQAGSAGEAVEGPVAESAQGGIESDIVTSRIPGDGLAVPGVERLWAETAGDPAICVAVLDGPDLSHPCFEGADLTRVETLATGTAADGPATGHGTHVASVIFGRHGSAAPGIAPGCRGLVVPVFTDGPKGSVRPCSQIDLARAIITQAVDAGARLINVSGGEIEPSGEPALRGRGGVLIVAAAGNDGCECLHVPAAVPSVLAVGAMDESGEPLGFSNWGEAYRDQGILAPGKDVLGHQPRGRNDPSHRHQRRHPGGLRGRRPAPELAVETRTNPRPPVGSQRAPGRSVRLRSDPRRRL